MSIILKQKNFKYIKNSKYKIRNLKNKKLIKQLRLHDTQNGIV